MMEGISNAVNAKESGFIGGNSEVKEKSIWILASEHNRKSKEENGSVTCVERHDKKGTYRPLPLR